MSCYHFWQSWENQNQNKSKRGEALLLPPQIVMGRRKEGRKTEGDREQRENLSSGVFQGIVLGALDTSAER